MLFHLGPSYMNNAIKPSFNNFALLRTPFQPEKFIKKCSLNSLQRKNGKMHSTTFEHLIKGIRPSLKIGEPFHSQVFNRKLLFLKNLPGEIRRDRFSWARCFKTFYIPTLRMFIISYSVCPWQAFSA
jgi:hypothetical protein